MRLGRALRAKPLMLHSPSYEVKPDPGAPGLDCVEHLNPFGGAPRERGNQSETNGGFYKHHDSAWSTNSPEFSQYRDRILRNDQVGDAIF